MEPEGVNWLTSLLAGGATGLLGTVATAAAGLLGKRGDRKHELEMRRLDLEEMKLESASADKRAALDAEIRTTEADAEMFKASMEHARTRFTQGMELPGWAKGCLAFVDVVRGLMRPLGTVGSFVCMVVMWQDPNPKNVHIVEALIYMSTTSFLWWFGDRALQRQAAAVATPLRRAA